MYDPATIRTIFLQFESADWEQELTAFYNTDVDVPATMIVDGRTFREVGVHFRGNSSFRMVPAGYKHSLNLTLGPIAQKYHALIAADVKADTRKLYSYEEFQSGLEGLGGIKAFADRRRAYLLKYTAR